MYTMFLKENYPDQYKLVEQGKKPDCITGEVSYHYYLKVFRDHYNYGFGRPRTDVCGKCEEMQVKISIEKNRTLKASLETDLKLHKARGKVFFSKLKEAAQISESEYDVESLCWDFQQNIPYPQLPVSEIFYLRQLWLFNFCVYSYKRKDGVMFSWPESEGNRGVNEVLTCLNIYIEKYVPQTVRKLHLFCDGCRGQNHNTYVINYFFSLVYSGRFDSIVLQFPVRGHSFLPCDRLFSVIEREKRRVEKVQSYTEWQNIISQRFTVEKMQHQHFLDYKKHYDGIFRKNFQQNKQKYQVTKYKVFRFSKNHKYEVEVSELMSGALPKRFRLLQPNAKVTTVPEAHLYVQQLCIKDSKLTNVLSLVRYLDEDKREYYANLQPIAGAPKRAKSEDDQDSDFE